MPLRGWESGYGAVRFRSVLCFRRLLPLPRPLIFNKIYVAKNAESTNIINHPGQNAVGSQHQHSMQPVGRADPEEKSGQVILKPEEEIGQKLRGDVGAGDGQPKNERQQKQHDRISGPAAGQNAINPAVEGIVAVSLTGDGIEAEVLGGQHQAGNDFVLDVGVGDALNGKGVSGAQHRRGDF